MISLLLLQFQDLRKMTLEKWHDWNTAVFSESAFECVIAFYFIFNNWR